MRNPPDPSDVPVAGAGPSGGAVAAEAPLREREVPLARLARAFDGARAGAGRLVIVRGEAGIGKSSLLREFTAHLPPGTTVAWGWCDPLTTPRALGPVIEIAAALGADVAESAQPVASARVLEALRQRGRAPVAIIEDAHWADEATAETLGYLARRIHRVPALVVVSVRDDEIDVNEPVRAQLSALAGVPGAEAVDLPRLSPAAVADLVGEDGDARAVWELTGGNPFFVTEMLASRPELMPRSVRDAVHARLALASAPAQSAAEVASVAGARCEVRVLERMLGAEASVVDELVERGILVARGDAVEFRHELARRAVYDLLPPARRASIHRRLLGILSSSPQTRADVARLVHHAVGAGDDDALLVYAPRAGHEAAARSAHREAVAHFRHVLPLAEALPADARAALLEGFVAESYIVNEEGPEVVDAIRSAVELRRAQGDVEAVVRDLCTLGTLLTVVRLDEADRVIDDAIREAEAAPPGPARVMAYRRRSHTRMLTRDCAESLAWADRALQVAEDIGMTDLHELRVTRATALLMAGDVDAGEALLRELAEEADAAGGTLARTDLARLQLGSGLGELGHAARARPHLVAEIENAREDDNLGAESYATAWLSLVELAVGDPGRAEQLAEAVVAGASSSLIDLIMARICLGRLEARAGGASAGEHLDLAVELADRTGMLQRTAPARAARAEAAWLAGDHERARTDAAAPYADALARGADHFVGELAYWQRQAGASVEVPDDVEGPWAMLARGDWRAAAGWWERAGHPYDRAHALAVGDDDALRLEALRVFDDLGARSRARVLRAQLRADGVRGIPRGPRRTTAAHPLGLTERELETLALAAEGLVNGAIAERLTVSPRTVDHHMSSILAKTGAATRGEAVAIARRAGALPDGHPARH